MNPFAQTFEDQDIVTIIAPSSAEAMRVAKARGLSSQGYAIQARIVPHRFTLAGDTEDDDLFSGEPMVAATWVRRRPQACETRTPEAKVVVAATA